MTKGLKRGLLGLVLLILLLPPALLLATPWLLPRLAPEQINRHLPDYINGPASLGGLDFDLYPLQLTLYDLRIGEPGSEPLYLPQLRVRVELQSLWRDEIHIEEISLQQPVVRVQIDRDGQLNLSKLLRLPASDSGAAAEPGAPLPAIRLDALLIDGGQLQLEDLRRPLKLDYSRLHLSLRQLHSRQGSALLDLVARGEQQPTLGLHAELDPQARRISGRLKLDDLQLARWLQLAPPLPLQASGRLDLRSQFLLELASERPQLQLQQGQIQLNNLRLREPGGSERLQMSSLQLDDLQLDLQQQKITIARLRSQGLRTHAVRNADGSLDWQQLLAGRQPASTSASTSTSTSASSTAATPAASSEPAAAPAEQTSTPQSSGWQLQLQKLQLADWRLALEEHTVSPALKVEVGPLNLQAGPLDSRLQQPVQLQLDTGLSTGGNLQLRGQLQPASQQASLQLDLQAIDLRPLQGWISPFIRIQLRGGQLDSQLAIEANAGSNPLALQVRGKASVSQLHVLDGIEQRDLLKWQRLQLDDLLYRHGELLQIGQIQLEQPYTRFILDEKRQSNLQALLLPRPPAEPSTAAASTPLHLQIGGLQISNGSAQFADRSLSPAFATTIQQLEGRIGALDNRSNPVSAVDIRGKVDRYAPVSIQGSLTPFDPLHRLDISTRFQRLELTTLTPYSGKFAGYSIRKGRLNLDLHYRIDNGQLNAENKVVLENLQLGERVDSPDATSLPVRLAIALLKDSQGRIDLEVPVSGDLNNPQFAVMPLVWKTLGNLIGNAVQAPFRLLGGLLSADEPEDLDQIRFDPASSTLDGDAGRILHQLAGALKQRPELKLEIEGLSNAALDGPPLAEARLQRDYREALYRVLQKRGDRLPASASELNVPDEERPPLLEALYRSRIGYPPPVEWNALKPAERLGRMEQVLRDYWAGNELLLRQLAQERAAAIREHLVEQQGLPDSRLFLVNVGNTLPDNGRIASRLHLDAE